MQYDIVHITSLFENATEGFVVTNGQGDIILVNDNQYRISTSNEVGEYRFSVTAQRVFFTSGPLKSLYAKTSTSNNTPIIVLPVAENQQQGLKISSEVWCYYKQ